MRFLTEAIFLGIYLFGWNRVPGWLHLFAGVVVSPSGLLSAIFVTLVNGWMNTPTGFEIVNGQFVNIHPFVAMLNPAGIPEAVHMALAAYTAAGFATAGIYSWLLLCRGQNRVDEVALGIALAVGGCAVLAQGLSGDELARMVAQTQPMKLSLSTSRLPAPRAQSCSFRRYIYYFRFSRHNETRPMERIQPPEFFRVRGFWGLELSL